MYCLRHSARPGQLIAMIEDFHASSRPSPKKNASKSEPTPLPNANMTNAGDTLEPASSALDSGGAVDKENIQAVPNEAHPPSISESNLPEPSSTLSNQNEFTPMVLDNYEHAAEEPAAFSSSTHYRISLISVPDSFEQLLTSAICASQTTTIPSAWCPRPNIVAIEGVTWGIYSSSFDGETGLPTPGPMLSTRSSKEIKPDWYLRLGTVTNKGATTGATSLPWLMLELECAATASELDPSSRFLESVMSSLIQPDEMLRVRPFRPTQQSFVEAGLMTQEDDVFAFRNLVKAASLRNGYCMLMLA